MAAALLLQPKVACKGGSIAMVAWAGQHSTALHRAGQHSNDTDYNPDPKHNLILALMLTLVYLGGCDMAVV